MHNFALLLNFLALCWLYRTRTLVFQNKPWMFCFEFCEISKNTFFLQNTSSGCFCRLLQIDHVEITTDRSHLQMFFNTGDLKRLHHWYFLVNFAKVLRILIIRSVVSACFYHNITQMQLRINRFKRENDKEKCLLMIFYNFCS